MSRAELDAAYRVTAVIADPKALLARMTEQSAAFRRNHPGIVGVRYGDSDAETLDLFFPPHAVRAAPVHVFIHGGYWYQFPKAHWSFVARGLAQRGMLVAVCDYELCPAVSITDITRQIGRAIEWLHTHVGAYGGDPERLHVSGHSAGAQLALMTALTASATAAARSPAIVKSVLGISGVYDLRPVQQCYVQEFVRLTDDEVDAMSPLANIRGSGTVLSAVVGDGETAEFVRQGREFTSAWCDAGNSGDFAVLSPLNHLNILDELADPAGRVCERAARLAGLTGRDAAEV